VSIGRRFNLLRELGSGAFGTVYLAEMESLGGFKKEVAIKLLNPELSSFSEASQRLRDEARLLGRLRHRNIVQVDDLVRLDGRWAVVMEHIGGYDLEVLQEALPVMGESIPALAAVEIAHAICSALDAAWATTTSDGKPLQVVHRDIKPSNVRITPEGDVKVLDFGIARADFAGREAKTGRVRYGSIGYMSPERLLGEPEVAAGDVFAVGCVLYELVVGRPLGRIELAPEEHARQVDEACQHLLTVLIEHTAADPNSSALAPSSLSEILRSCLAYKPEDRPSARSVSEACRKVAKGLEGEDLVSFAGRIIPKVAAAIDDRTRPARGSLEEEGSAGRTAEDAQDTGSASPTLVLDGDSGPFDVPESEDEAATAPSRMPLFIGVAVALLVVLGIGGAVMMPGDETPVVTEEVEPVAEPVAEPVVEEPVVEEPVAEEPVIEEPAEEPIERVERPRVTPKPVVTRPPAPVEPVVAEVTPAADAKRLRAVKFTVTGASSVSATCGDTSASGASSALLRDLPAGACVVKATVDGASLSTTVQVDTPRGVDCAAEGGVLACR